MATVRSRGDSDVLDVHQGVEEQVVEGGYRRFASAVGQLPQFGHQLGARAIGVPDRQVTVDRVEIAPCAQPMPRMRRTPGDGGVNAMCAATSLTRHSLHSDG